MGLQKRELEKTIPPLGKKEFQQELDFLVFSKNKSQTVTIKKNGHKL